MKPQGAYCACEINKKAGVLQQILYIYIYIYFAEFDLLLPYFYFSTNMTDYNPHRLRSATESVMAHLSVLYSNHAATSQLAAAIAELISVQESINTAFNSALQSERRQRLRTEARLSVLETFISKPAAAYRAVQDSQTAHAADLEPQEKQNVADSQADEKRIAPTSPEQSQNIAPVRKKQTLDDAKQKPINRPPLNATTAPAKPQKRTTERARLPTVGEVQAKLDADVQVMRKRRKDANREPPPCAKCRVRKRAEMLREFGRVDEDAFERWSRRPGGCFGFIHMNDQPAQRSALTFTETATQPP